jgi:copper chaperone CopZ
MTCGHCVETVGRTLRQSPGVRRVEVNLKEGRATVTGEHLDPARLIAAVNALGYEMHLYKP